MSRLALIHEDYITGKTADALRESEQFFNQELIDKLWPDGSGWPVSVPPREYAEAVATIEVKAVLLASLHKTPMESVVWTDRRLTALAADLPVLISAGYAPLWRLMDTYGCLAPMAHVLAHVGITEVQVALESLPSAVRDCILDKLPVFMTQALAASSCDLSPLADCFAADELSVLATIWQLNWTDHQVWFARVQAAIQSVIDTEEPFSWLAWLRAYRMAGCVLWLADYREPLLQHLATHCMQQLKPTTLKPCLDQLLWQDRQWLIAHFYQLANHGSVKTREQAWPFHKQLCDWYTGNE